MKIDRKWIAPATSVLALLISTASAQAASDFWSNFYVSMFGGAAMGTGSVSASGADPECGYDPEACIVQMVGTVGNGFAGGVAAGTNILPNTQIELELSTANLGTTTTTEAWDPENPGNVYTGTVSGNLMATFMFGNIWYDIPLNSQFTAYVGGGAGIASVSGLFSAPITSPTTTDLSLVASGFAPAVQVGGGVTYGIAPNITLDFGYRFKQAFNVPVSQASTFDTALDNITSSTSMNLGVHVIQVGLKFALP